VRKGNVNRYPILNMEGLKSRFINPQPKFQTLKSAISDFNKVIEEANKKKKRL
jgi:hypothetical protein